MNAGTQKYVHSKCLRRWQDSVQRLVQWRDKIDGKPLLMTPDFSSVSVGVTESPG